MNKRIRKKTEKRFFLSCFNKKDWILYNRYPRLFATYSTYHEFTLEDLNRWYWNKFSCNKDIFQNIVKSLSCYVNFDSSNADFENSYSNLEKYRLVDLMDNIESIWMNERLPRRIEDQLAHYLINIPKINTEDAIKNILRFKNK